MGKLFRRSPIASPTEVNLVGLTVQMPLNAPITDSTARCRTKPPHSLHRSRASSVRRKQPESGDRNQDHHLAAPPGVDARGK